MKVFYKRLLLYGSRQFQSHFVWPHENMTLKTIIHTKIIYILFNLEIKIKSSRIESLVFYGNRLGYQFKMLITI